MKAIIVVGGRGERLRPFTDTVPKPMLEIGGKPILSHTIHALKKNGIRDFIFALCYLPKAIKEYFGNGNKFGVSIDYTYEDPQAPLGSAGAITLSKGMVNETFIVTSGDILRDLNTRDMIRFHKKQNAHATINVYKRYGKNPKSSVIFKKSGRIQHFVERPQTSLLRDDFVWSNGSFYIFEPEIYDYIPQGTFSDFGRDIFPKLLSDKRPFFAYPSDGYFVDIGTAKNFKEAKKQFKLNYPFKSG